MTRTELEATVQRLEALRCDWIGTVTPCPNCDGSGNNAHGSCCRIPGHAKDCECAVCQWKNATYARQHELAYLRTRLETAERQRDVYRTRLEASPHSVTCPVYWCTTAKCERCWKLDIPPQPQSDPTPLDTGAEHACDDIAEAIGALKGQE